MILFWWFLYAFSLLCISSLLFCKANPSNSSWPDKHQLTFVGSLPLWPDSTISSVFVCSYIHSHSHIRCVCVVYQLKETNMILICVNPKSSSFLVRPVGFLPKSMWPSHLLTLLLPILCKPLTSLAASCRSAMGFHVSLSFILFISGHHHCSMGFYVAG